LAWRKVDTPQGRPYRTNMPPCSRDYLRANAPDLDISQLDIQLTELALWIVKTSKVRDASLPTISRRLTRAVEDEVYAATLHAAPQDFIGGGAPWPLIRTCKDPHALQAPLPTTIKMRNDTLLAIYRSWAGAHVCGKDIYDNGYDHWLPQVEQVVQAAITKPNGDPKMKNTIRIALKCLRALCEATQQPVLKKQYEDLLLPHCLESDEDEDTRKRLSEEQIARLYLHLNRMHVAAMKAVAAKDLKPCIEYLVLALHWGDAPGLLQPQRNDMRSFRFQGPQTDIDNDNYVTLEHVTTLTLNKRNKPNKASSSRCTIDLSPNNKLCAFLQLYKHFVGELQPNTTEPYLLCSRTGQPMNSSALSSRVHHIWKTNLEPKLGFNGAGCNVCRRAAVDAARRSYGKRKMSAAELKEEAAQCRARGHSVHNAEKYY
jgi:hypothetical protein